MPAAPAYHVPDTLTALLDATQPLGVCGTCSGYEGGRCVARDLLVQKGDPGCVMYDHADT